MGKQKKKKEEVFKINMSFEEAMKKALATPLPKEELNKDEKKATSNLNSGSRNRKGLAS